MVTGGSAAPRWRVLGRSVRGASHVRAGLPNQDAVATSTTANASGLPAIAAVADGHGGARHFRSGDGARLAVEAALQVLKRLAPRLDPGRDAGHEHDRAEIARRAAVEVPAAIVADWTERVRADLAARPIGDAEWRALDGAEGAASLRAVRDDPVLAYGATLLAVLAVEGGIALFQLGDGDVLAVTADGATTRPVPSDERLAANLTTSLCRPGAERDFRSIVLAPQPAAPVLILLSTDGYANSFRTDADYLQVGRDYLALVRARGIEAIDPELPRILDDASVNGSGDDISLALLLDAGRLASEQPGEPGVRETALAAELQHARARIARLRGAIGVLALLLCVWIGWTERGRLPALRLPGPPAPALQGDTPAKPAKRGDSPAKGPPIPPYEQGAAPVSAG